MLANPIKFTIENVTWVNFLEGHRAAVRQVHRDLDHVTAQILDIQAERPRPRRASKTFGASH